MAQSRRFHKLRQRLLWLENNFLPDERVLQGYSHLETDLIRSYILLAHAEIESYFEDVARETVTRCLRRWADHKLSGRCLTCIMAFCSSDIDWSKGGQGASDLIDFRLNKAVSHFLSKISKNHGIKSKNILDMLLPIGVERSFFDETWLVEMDSFGEKRGGIAHSTHMVRQQIDMRTELDKINNLIMPEIGNIDDLIRRLK